MKTPLGENQWTRRYDAVSAVQRRYLVVLLLLSALFSGLAERVAKLGGTGLDSAELFGVHVGARALWSFAPAILLLLLLAFLGASSAARVARRRAGPGRIEPFDLHPNFIDMLVYQRRKLVWPGSLVSRLAYPVALTLFFLEAWWLQAVAWRSAPPRSVLSWVALLLTCLLTIPTLYRLVPFAQRRLPASWKPRSTQRKPASPSTIGERAR